MLTQASIKKLSILIPSYYLTFLHDEYCKNLDSFFGTIFIGHKRMIQKVKENLDSGSSNKIIPKGTIMFTQTISKKRSSSINHRDVGVNYGKIVDPQSGLVQESPGFKLWELPPLRDLEW